MRTERGSGRLGLFIWILMMAAGIFVASRTIPVRIAVMKLHDFADEQTRYVAVTHRGGEQRLIKEVLDKAHELGIPLERKQLRFENLKNVVRLHMTHDVSIDLEFYTWTWHYDKTFEHIKL
ncbi:MAG: hypothetical protein D6718_01425 [Acidobacteria bacterium]|nr:MAG: hypothetical protein D6718_01425 [Acidobacteriota bacterium]